MISRFMAARGFTLLEVMIAVSIFAVLAILSWRGLDTLVRGRERIAGAQQQAGELQRLVTQWERDTKFLVSGLAITTFYATANGVNLIRRVSAPADLTTSQTGNSAATGLYYQQVRYFLDKEKTLWREPSVPVSAALFTAALSKDPKEGSKLFVAQGQQAMLHAVEQLGVKVFFNGAWQSLVSVQAGSADSTVTTATNPIAYGGVRLDLTVKGQRYYKLFLTTP